MLGKCKWCRENYQADETFYDRVDSERWYRQAKMDLSKLFAAWAKAPSPTAFYHIADSNTHLYFLLIIFSISNTPSNHSHSVSILYTSPFIPPLRYTLPMSHCLACSYTVANLEDPDPLVTIPSFMKEKKRKHTVDDMATEVDKSLEPSESTLKPKCGRPSAKKSLPRL